MKRQMNFWYWPLKLSVCLDLIKDWGRCWNQKEVFNFSHSRDEIDTARVKECIYYTKLPRSSLINLNE